MLPLGTAHRPTAPDERERAMKRSVDRWGLFFSAVGLLILWSWVGDWVDYQRLAAEPRFTTGVVTGHRVQVTRSESRSNGFTQTRTETAYKVAYRYQAKEVGPALTHEVRVAPALFDTLATGSPVRVRYAADEPGVSALDADFSPNDSLLTAGFNLVWFLGVGLYWTFRKRLVAWRLQGR